MKLLKQSTAKVISFGPFLDKADGLALLTGLVNAIDHVTTGIMLSKNGGAFAVRHAAVTASTYDAYGNYLVTLDVTDTNTLGLLRVQFAAAATTVPVWEDFMVVPAAIYNLLVAGTTPLFDLLGITAGPSTMASPGGHSTTQGSFAAGEGAKAKVGALIWVPGEYAPRRIKTLATDAWTVDAGDAFSVDPAGATYYILANPINLPFVAGDFGDASLTDAKFQTSPASIAAKLPTAPIAVTVGVGSHTTVKVAVSTATGYGNHVLNGRPMQFLTGALAGLLVKITDYVSVTGEIDFQNVLGFAAPAAPSNGDTAVIL